MITCLKNLVCKYKKYILVRNDVNLCLTINKIHSVVLLVKIHTNQCHSFLKESWTKL